MDLAVEPFRTARSASACTGVRARAIETRRESAAFGPVVLREIGVIRYRPVPTLCRFELAG